MKMHKIGIGVMCLMFVVFFGATLEVSGQNTEEEMCLPMGIKGSAKNAIILGRVIPKLNPVQHQSAITF
jgi:hypothetical protein